MLRTSRRVFTPFIRCRHYSDAPSPVKASAKLVGELRRHTEVSITKAREALAATNNDVQQALEWLREDLAKSGALKAEKVASRIAGEGVLALSVLSEGWGTRQGGVRAALVELNCETDFVARSDMFNTLAAQVAYTTAYLSEAAPSSFSNSFLQNFPLEVLNDAPLLSKSSTTSPGTVLTTIQEAISKVGEKITLRRAVSLVADPLTIPNAGLRIGSYVHGSQAGGEDAHTGRIASLVAVGLNSPSLPPLKLSPEFQTSLSTLTRAIARQTVGLETRSIRSSDPSKAAPDPESTALYSQPFLMLPDADQEFTVEETLRSWAKKNGLGEDENTGVEVLDFARWTVGEGIEKVNDFAEEVKRLSSLPHL